MESAKRRPTRVSSKASLVRPNTNSAASPQLEDIDDSAQGGQMRESRKEPRVVVEWEPRARALLRCGGQFPEFGVEAA